MKDLPPPGAGTSEALRAHGLRSTPQRRAILRSFAGGDTEHLTADEVVERSRRELPELGRGTVYATLGELVRVGLLRNLGRADAVRYETNVGSHQHFRCGPCGRLYDLHGAAGEPPQAPPGFAVDQVQVVLEGTCASCASFAAGLHAAVRAVRHRAGAYVRDAAELAVDVVESPVGPLTLAASPRGLVRLAFADHADARLLAERAGGRPGRRGGHLAATRSALEAYFGAPGRQPEVAIDWEAVPGAARSSLAGTAAIPFAQRRSYHVLPEGGAPDDARALGRWLGENPVPLVVPCHRVLRGPADLVDYTGGLERKQALLAGERERPAPSAS
jgi:methylated-DNA-[protein]-cysteine S-methyltransferase